MLVNPNSIERGEGQIDPATQNLENKGPCLHNNHTALIKQISLFDAALVTQRLKVSIQKVLTFDQ